MQSESLLSGRLKRYRKLFKIGEIGISDFDSNVQSWIGHASHANTNGLMKDLFSEPFKRG